MTRSWHNFFFASLDPGGWVTVDKPPFAFWVEALSARIFGFSSFSILLPSAIAGAGAVALLIVTVRRVWCRPAGLIAGAVLACTPIVVAVSRSNNPDVYLMVAVVAAFFCIERAVATSRLRWMVLAGAFVGVGFLAKLGAALIAVPALWVAFLVGSRVPWGKRLLHGVIGGAMTAALAFGWIAVVDLTPATSRPYIGGSTDGTAWDLVTGYNGLGRVTGADEGPGGGGFPGGGNRGGFPSGRNGGAFPGGFGGDTDGVVDQFGGATGIDRLFNTGMGDQVMWLFPIAAAGGLGCTILLVRRRLSKSQAASLVALGGWAATAYVTFADASGIFHNYYVSMLAPALAGLVAIGVKLVLDGGRLTRAIAGAVLGVTALLQLSFLRRVESLTWLRVVVPAAIVAAALALVVVLWRQSGRPRVALGVVAGAAAALLIAPTAWAVSSLGHAASGTFPDARPLSSGASGPFGGTGAAPPGGGTFAGGPVGGLGGGLDDAELTWLRGQRSTEKWLIAVSSSMEAAPSIIDGDSVMAIGGFSGSDPTMNADSLARLVRDGDLRFVAAGGGGFASLGSAGGVMAIVQSECTEVPASTWGGTGSSIYDCKGKAAAIRSSTANVPGGSVPGASVPGGSEPANGQPGTERPVGLDQIQECLASQGVDAPDLSQGTPDFNDPEFTTALQKCGVSVAAP
jgi:4-amino-4-deoxy-L-arabinose transferase-like glycosyltransferase